MSTPIYDALVVEKSRTWTPEEIAIAEHITSMQKNWIPANPVANWGNPAWITTTLTVTKPAPRWKTFLRCLGWWKR